MAFVYIKEVMNILKLTGAVRYCGIGHILVTKIFVFSNGCANRCIDLKM